MKPTPAGWPRLSSSIFYQDAATAIDWLCKAFGFEVRLKVEGEGGRIVHSELTYGDGLIMVSQEQTESPERQWKTFDAQPAIARRHDDPEPHAVRRRCGCALRPRRAMGASIVEEPATHDYGAEYWADRSYGALDPEGHMWWITQRVRSAPAA